MTTIPSAVKDIIGKHCAFHLEITPYDIIQGCKEYTVSKIKMEKDSKVATEEPKIDLFEDDDEFEEFEINEEWDEKEGKEATQQWEDDWDDDDVSDDFSLQLRRELESNNVKS
ncbi:hypothetical protein AgCh_030782 [Apium graveolens]